MTKVSIPKTDSITWDDFEQQNSVQVRITVSANEANELHKGSIVEVEHENQQAKAKIVSEPLSIDDRTGENKKVLSLIIEKAK